MRSGFDEVREALEALASHIGDADAAGTYVSDVAPKYLKAMGLAPDAVWAAYYGHLCLQELTTGAQWLQQPDAERAALATRAGRSLREWETTPYADAELRQWQQDHGIADDQLLRKDGPPPVA